jgi:hypothetical protein
MHVYQLNDKKTDQEFLNGEIVCGKAIVSGAETNLLQPGETLLVILSNGKKYKATVTKAVFFVLGEYHVGEIEFIRSSFYKK